jgi:Cdc6-like AAA superfamily ATPase
MPLFRKEISDVFTPRNESVNKEMYISRGDHEKNLFRSIKGSMHSFLSGESGTGKSWLYKKVFSEKKINFKAVNCANASRQGSITDEIYSKCITP